MFSRIAMPVDLGHVARLQKALKTTADLARLYDIPVVYLGATSPLPGGQGHTPEEFAKHLAEFAEEQGRTEGIRASSHRVLVHDPSIDLDRQLLAAIDAVEADLVVMASHVPNLMDYLWPSNGGTVASHAKVSVLLVRE